MKRKLATDLFCAFLILLAAIITPNVLEFKMVFTHNTTELFYVMQYVLQTLFLFVFVLKVVAIVNKLLKGIYKDANR